MGHNEKTSRITEQEESFNRKSERSEYPKLA